MTLPLTPVEEFFLWQDRRALPFHIFARLRFEGSLDRAAVEIALQAALKRHPLLRAKIERAGGNGLRWIVMDDYSLSLKCTTDFKQGEFPAANVINLFEGIGIRFHLAADNTESHFVIQVHHACCDAVGLFQFINDFLIGYARVRDPAELALKLPPLDPARLASRGCLTERPAKIIALLDTVRILLRNPQALLPHAPNDEEAEPLPPFPRVLTHVLDRDETNELRLKAKRQQQSSGITLNDLLVSALFTAIREWRERAGVPAPDRGCLRLVVPKNMRAAADEVLPAANRVSPLIFDRRNRDLINVATVQSGIRAEMNRIARWRLLTAFPFFLHACRFLPGGIERFARRNQRPVTSVLSNLGRVLEDSPLPRGADGCLIAGDVVLRHAEFVVPCGSGWCAAFGVTVYAGRLHITLHYDPSALDVTQARDLLESFVRRIHTGAGNSVIASVSARRSLPELESLAPPGKRHAIPTSAIGSLGGMERKD
jgi:hypothetical protein